MVKFTETERTEILMMVDYIQSTVSELVRKFRETGNVKDIPRSGRPKSATNQDQALDVLLSVMDNPITSTTQLALDNDISQSSVVRILKKNKHKPYTFCLNGFVNRHSCRYWSSENPHWMMEHHSQHPQNLNVWDDIIGHHILYRWKFDGR
jgi:DNA polymerase II small subunit/DNA polymerase delta subunit B